MMKSFLLALLATAGSAQVYGQSETIPRDTVKIVNGDKFQVTTNSFWNNWFVGGGVGVMHYFGDHNRQMKFSDALSTSYSGYLGKRFTPVISTRLGIAGGKIVGVTQNEAHSTGEKYEGKPFYGYRLYNQEFNYFHVFGDAMFNLSNLFGGYKADRFYEISPFIGLGWMVTNDNPKAREVSANIGILNTFRLNSSFHLTLDIRGAMVNDRFDGELGRRKEEGPLSAQVGIVYSFRKRDWERSTNIVVRYDDQVLNALREKVNRLAQDNDALRRQLADSKSKTITEVKTQDRVLAAPVLLTFPINQSVVSNEARTNLSFLAEVIKSGSSNVVYMITGYADRGTGSAMTNERLSKERAEAVFQVLTKEFRVNPKQLNIDFKGGVDNMFYDDPRLSRAVITIAEVK